MLLQIGVLAVAILPTAQLRSANNQSQVSTASTTVTQGSWGDGYPPALLPKSTSAVRVVLYPPPSASQRYPVTRYLVQVR